jgi:hypothetical protein
MDLRKISCESGRCMLLAGSRSVAVFGISDVEHSGSTTSNLQMFNFRALLPVTFMC